MPNSNINSIVYLWVYRYIVLILVTIKYKILLFDIFSKAYLSFIFVHVKKFMLMQNIH